MIKQSWLFRIKQTEKSERHMRCFLIEKTPNNDIGTHIIIISTTFFYVAKIKIPIFFTYRRGIK